MLISLRLLGAKGAGLFGQDLPFGVAEALPGTSGRRRVAVLAEDEVGDELRGSGGDASVDVLVDVPGDRGAGVAELLGDDRDVDTGFEGEGRARAQSRETQRVRVVIEGFDLPGRTFCSRDGSRLDGVHVGVQVGREPRELVAGDAASARWELDISVVPGPDGSLDFRGPPVHGKRGDRFLYLTWGNVDGMGHFARFRRAKLMLNRVDQGLVREVEQHRRRLVGTVRLTDSDGGPQCARVDPPYLEWAID